MHASMRKAAILLASLDRRTADVLLEQMSAEEADAVRRAAVALDEIDLDEQHEVFDEFLNTGPMSRHRHLPASSNNTIDAALSEVQSSYDGVELAGALLDSLQAGWNSPSAPYCEGPPHESTSDSGGTAKQAFRFLSEAECEQLTPFLQDEHPQTIAVVVSHLPAERSAELIAGLPPSLQADVLNRLVSLQETTPEILREVERGLESRISQHAASNRRRAAGLATVAAILAAANRFQQRQLFSSLAAHAPQLAHQLARPAAQISFNDLVWLDDASLARLLRSADPQWLMLALAGASVNFVERILAHLPPLDAQRVRREWHNLGPTVLSDVEAAQQLVLELALQLEASGDIELPRSERNQRARY